jgi:hypothetical protein
MTTARDVIAEWLREWNIARTPMRATEIGNTLIERILSAPDSVRLELAALINPWRPIETAPKDGDTNILLGCFGEHSHGEQFVAFWDDEAKLDTHHWQTADGIAYHDGLPTHWLPRPAPPLEPVLVAPPDCDPGWHDVVDRIALPAPPSEDKT